MTIDLLTHNMKSVETFRLLYVTLFLDFVMCSLMGLSILLRYIEAVPETRYSVKTITQTFVRKLTPLH